MIQRTLSAFAVVAISMGCFACSTEVVSDDTQDEDQSADHLDAQAKCSTADYNAANTAYKKAVALAKTYNSQQCEVDQGEIAGKMSESVQTCEAFRGVYQNSQWAAPVRKALEGNFIDGILRGKKFDAALVGSHFEAARPGVGPAQFEFTFDSATKMTFTTNTFDETDNWVAKNETLSYTIEANTEDESAGWILTIQGKGAEGKAEYRLLRQETEDEAGDRARPTYVIEMVEDEEVVLYSYADVCSA